MRNPGNKYLPLFLDSPQFLLNLAQKSKVFAIDQPVGLPLLKSARHQNAVWLLTDADRRQAPTCHHMFRKEFSHSSDIALVDLQHLFEVITKRRRPERAVYYSGLGDILTICVRKLGQLRDIYIPRF